MLSRALKILLLLTAVIPAAGQTVGGNDATFEVPRTLKGMVIEPSPETQGDFVIITPDGAKYYLLCRPN